MIIPIVVGALLAGLALAFVLGPVVFRASGSPGPFAPRRDFARSDGPAVERRDDGARAIDVLREVEFDRETGKLSTDDYEQLKATYTARALVELRESAAPLATAARVAAPSADSGIGACPACHARLRPDARYCSNCAEYVSRSCPDCGSPVRRPAAQFCTDCGRRLNGTP